MPKYRIQTPDGKTLEYDVPAGVTAAQALAHAQQSYGAKPTVPVSTRQQGVQAAAKAAIAAKPAPAPSTLGSLFRGVQDSIPGINHIEAAANEAGSALGLNNSNLSYSDRVKAIQQQRDQDIEGDKSAGWGPYLAHYAGEIGGALGGGAGEARAATKGLGVVASKIAPAAPKVANVIQGLTDLGKGNILARGAKIAGAGATAGAIQGAGDSTGAADLPGNVAKGAAVGAIAAPVASAGLKVAAAVGRPIADLTGLSTAAGVLRRYVSASAEDLEQKFNDYRAKTGANPTIFELLPLQDRQNVQKMLGLSSGATKTQATEAIAARAKNIGPEMGDVTTNAIAQQRNAIQDQMAQDLAQSRGGANAVPTVDELNLAHSAARSPVDMSTLRDVEARNIMAPHDARTVAPSVDHLVPQAPTMQPNGSVSMQESNPDISAAIRSKAGLQRVDPTGVTVSDISDMISKLRSDGRQGGVAGDTATRAADHLTDFLQQSDPAAAQALQNMQSAYAGRSRMLEGFGEGTQTRLRENVPVGTSRGTAQGVRNAYDTPEGSAGRVLGQASQLDQQLTQTPGQNLRSVTNIAEDPTTQEAISRNLGNDAGPQIADAAQAQTTSARNLAGLNPETQNSSGMDLPTLAHSLIALNPASLPTTKALAMSRIMHAFQNLPEKQTSAIVDGLFSQNPTQISKAMKFLNNAGDSGKAALSTLGNVMSAGGAAAGVATSPSTEQQPAQPSMSDIPEQPAGTAPGDIQDPNAQQPNVASGTPVDPSASPYTAQLQKIYDQESPDFLNLVDRIQKQESGGKQFDKDGKPLQSGAGAVGIMQLEPSTAQQTAQDNGIPYDENALHNDPAYNKLLGVHTIASLLHKYNGNVTKATAAYNAGPGAVDRNTADDGTLNVGGLPQETQDYIKATS